MSKFKRTNKQAPPQGKKVKIFDLYPTGVYGKMKAKDFKGIIKSSKKGNKMGGVIKASEGVSVSPKMTDYTKNLIGKADQGLGKAITQGKNLLSAIGTKVKKAGEIMRKGPSAAITKAGPVKDFAIAKEAAKASFKPPTKTLSAGKSKALVTGRTAKLFKAARFARAVTPIGAASIVIGAATKKRDPKAVKRERDFYKGKKYKDVGFESMMDYAKPKKKGGVISYNKGGFNYAINRKR